MPCDNHGKGKVILRIKGDAEGSFVERKNRFLAEVKIGNAVHFAHIHDPGRLKELLYPGNAVLLKRYSKEKRKTEWEIIAAKYHGRWVLTNSKFHRPISERIIMDKDISPFGDVDEIKAEVKIGKSRIDYLLLKNGKRIWVEVKGCTLKKGGVALFPDAPTERGRRHVEELHRLLKSGDLAALMILIFHEDAKCFSPNRKMDEKFAKAYDTARRDGLKIYPIKLNYDGRKITFQGLIHLCEN